MRYSESREAVAAEDGVMTLKLGGGYDRFRVDESKGRRSYDASFIGAAHFNRAIVAIQLDSGVTAGGVKLEGAHGAPGDATWEEIVVADKDTPVQSVEIAWTWLRLSVANYDGTGDIRAWLTLRND